MEMTVLYQWGVPTYTKGTLYLAGFRYYIRGNEGVDFHDLFGDDHDDYSRYNDERDKVCFKLEDIPFAEYDESDDLLIKLVIEFPLLLDISTFPMEQVALLQERLKTYLEQKANLVICKPDETDIYFMIVKEEEKPLPPETVFFQLLTELGFDSDEFMIDEENDNDLHMVSTVRSV